MGFYEILSFPIFVDGKKKNFKCPLETQYSGQMVETKY